jgi:hypothetical protein
LENVDIPVIGGGTFHAFPNLSEGVRYACQAVMD